MTKVSNQAYNIKQSENKKYSLKGGFTLENQKKRFQMKSPSKFWVLSTGILLSLLVTSLPLAVKSDENLAVSQTNQAEDVNNPTVNSSLVVSDSTTEGNTGTSQAEMQTKEVTSQPSQASTAPSPSTSSDSPALASSAQGPIANSDSSSSTSSAQVLNASSAQALSVEASSNSSETVSSTSSGSKTNARLQKSQVFLLIHQKQKSQLHQVFRQVEQLPMLP